MQFQAGADVLNANDEKVGKVDRVVLDPRSKEVTHLVVRKGALFKTDKVLPVGMVASTDPDRVRLRPDAEALAGLPDFEETHYVAADNGVGSQTSRAMDEALATSPGALGSSFGAAGTGVVA